MDKKSKREYQLPPGKFFGKYFSRSQTPVCERLFASSKEKASHYKILEINLNYNMELGKLILFLKEATYEKLLLKILILIKKLYGVGRSFSFHFKFNNLFL